MVAPRSAWASRCGHVSGCCCCCCCREGSIRTDRLAAAAVAVAVIRQPCPPSIPSSLTMPSFSAHTRPACLVGASPTHLPTLLPPATDIQHTPLALVAPERRGVDFLLQCNAPHEKSRHIIPLSLVCIPDSLALCAPTDDYRHDRNPYVVVVERTQPT